MKFTPIFTLLIASLASNAYGQCPVVSGDNVKIQSPESVWTALQAADLEKGEFETTAQFEARKAQANITPIDMAIIQTTVDRKDIKYDADNSQFTIVVYAWDNIGINWSEALSPAKSKGLEYGYYGNHGIVLKQIDTFGKQYQASNAYGASTTVTEMTETSYAVFDRKSDLMGGPKWVTDFETQTKIAGTEITVDAPAVGVPVPINRAKIIKDKLNVAIAVRPKGIKAVEGLGSFSATISNPYDKREVNRTVIADILCAIITDGSGKVLRTVQVDYNQKRN